LLTDSTSAAALLARSPTLSSPSNCQTSPGRASPWRVTSPSTVTRSQVRCVTLTLTTTWVLVSPGGV